MIEQEEISFEDAKKEEESVLESLKNRSELWQAIANRQLYFGGMDLEKAKKIKRRAGLIE